MIGISEIIVTVSAVDLKERKFAGKDEYGTEFVFHFSPAAKLRKLTPTDVTTSLDEMLRRDPAAVPLRLEQKVLVAWKPDPSGKKRIAVKLTIN